MGDATTNYKSFAESKMFATEKEGNCLRYFALQDVSREAMRKALDSMPDKFETIWKRFMKYCNDNNRKSHHRENKHFVYSFHSVRQHRLLF